MVRSIRRFLHYCMLASMWLGDMHAQVTTITINNGTTQSITTATHSIMTTSVVPHSSFDWHLPVAVVTCVAVYYLYAVMKRRAIRSVRGKIW